MLVKLIGKNTVESLSLPDNGQGQYSISFGEKSIRAQLVFTKNANAWVISEIFNCSIPNEKQDSDKDKKTKDEKQSKIVLKKYSFYHIKIEKTGESYILYCSPKYEDNYSHLQIKNTSAIYIGRDKKSNHIIYDSPLIQKVHAKIYFFNGFWYIENYDENFCILVNGKPVRDNTQVISNGDWINIFRFNNYYHK